MSSKLGLSILIIFCGSFLSAAVPKTCRGVLEDEAAKSVQLQKEIKAARAVVSGNSFVTSRGLVQYKMSLHPAFSLELSRLGPEQVWMDLGGGRGNAVEQFLQDFSDLGRAPRVVLVSYSLGFLRSLSDFNGRLQVFKGRYWEDIPQREIPSVNLVSDFFGVLSYTHDLSLCLQKVFDSLVVGGHLFLHSTHYITHIRNRAQKVLSLTEFLSSIEGLEVEGKFGILKVKKAQANVQIPKLRLVGLDNGPRPAVRVFDLAQ